MKKTELTFDLERFGNYVALLIVITIITLAFAIQIFESELPCPLCLLQRVGFIAIGMGFLMNLYFGYLSRHYAISLLSSLFTFAVALRQVALHVLPNTGSYGESIYGMHLYTWSAVAAFCFMIGISILLILHQGNYQNTRPSRLWPIVLKTITYIFLLIILANIAAVYLECGLSICPDNPDDYKTIDKFIN